MNALLDAALHALDAGWNVLPVNARKAPHFALVETGHFKINPEGRRVPSWKGLQHERVTPDHLKVWFGPRLNVPGFGAVTGAISGRVVLDFDGAAGQQLCQRWGLSPSALSGSGSPHVYVRHPGWPVRTFASGSLVDPPFPGLDVRGDGGMIVLPPSVLSNGPYRLLREGCYEVAALPEAVAHWAHLACPLPATLPAWQPDGHEQPSAQGIDELLTLALSRVDGGRNNAGYWLARQLCAAGVEKSAAKSVMQRFVDHMPPHDSRGRRDPYPVSHALSSLESAYSAPVRHRSATSQEKVDPLVLVKRFGRCLALDERAELARLIAGAYGRLGLKEAQGALQAVGLPITAAQAAVAQLEAGVSLPGMAKLQAFLQKRSEQHA